MEINNLQKMDLIIVTGTLNEIIKLSNTSKVNCCKCPNSLQQIRIIGNRYFGIREIHTPYCFLFFSEQVLYFIRLVLCNMFETIVRTIT